MGLKQLLADLTGLTGALTLPDGDQVAFRQKSYDYDHNATSIHRSSDHPFITYGFSDEFELNEDNSVKTEQNIIYNIYIIYKNYYEKNKTM